MNCFCFSLQGKPWPAAEWKFYVAFALFRGASIYAGIYSRYMMVISWIRIFIRKKMYVYFYL